MRHSKNRNYVNRDGKPNAKRQIHYKNLGACICNNKKNDCPIHYPVTGGKK